MESQQAFERQRAAYRQTLQGLRDFMHQLGLGQMPTGSVTIGLQANGEGRPLGAQLPVYPPEECGTTQGKFEKVLFNLASLTGFTPPGLKK